MTVRLSTEVSDDELVATTKVLKLASELRDDYGDGMTAQAVFNAWVNIMLQSFPDGLEQSLREALADANRLRIAHDTELGRRLANRRSHP